MHQNIPTMAISMNKIVNDKHLEESISPNASNLSVQRMLMVFEVGDWNSLGKGLHKKWLVGIFGEGEGELYFFILFEHLSEN